MRIADVLEKDLNYFPMDTTYVNGKRLIDHEIAAKLNQCNASILIVENVGCSFGLPVYTQHRAERATPRQRYRLEAGIDANSARNYW